jgi:L-ascorbate metabolism protein UlaG (beta-lactamase superfamily)
MKITKYEHSCLLVEMPAPINRTALFDPGVMSEGVLDVNKLEFLDDIIITHSHADHISMKLIKELVAKFPEVRITSTQEVVDRLAQESITATANESDGIVFFDAPHEATEPLFPTPTEIGVHYLNLLTHPGDSHTFSDSKAVLALPITAPWGATIKAVNLALEHKPKFVIPIHDWHWRDEAREQMYGGIAKAFEAQGITFLKPKNGEPIVIDV